VWQWTYQVYVQVRKSTVRDWNLLWLQMHVSVSFSTLTAQAGPGGGGGLLLHVWPAEGGGNQAARSSYSRVVNIVK
jgi:hypothetical protein